METPEPLPLDALPQNANAAEPAPVQAAPDECWSRIGVQGDRSCPELSRHVHCRNCPSYARAGALLLNRPLPTGYRPGWAAHFAAPEPCTLPPGTSVTVFRIGPEWLAWDTTLLQEITESRPMHTVPHRRMGVVLGLVNVRGEMLLCVSLARLLGLDYEICRERLRREPLRLVVAQAGAQRFAFPVDEIHGVQRLHHETLKPPPATVARARFPFTHGIFRWRQHTVGCLDAEAVLFHLNRSLA